MSLYPDWIGVDVGSGSVLVEGYSVVMEDLEYDVAIELDYSVNLEDSDYEVDYGR
jgi:hypothetical protein